MFRRTILGLVIIAWLLGAPATRGEGNITWASIGGPTGGLVNALAFAPNVPGVIYAGTNGGVYLSRDDGAHWQNVSKGLPDDPTVTALAVMHDPNIVFAGTRYGIYRTRDGGGNWSLTDPRFGEQIIFCLLVDPQNQTLYAGTATTVLRSDNGGDSWNDVGADLKSARVWALALTADSSALYAATDSGLYVSRTRGASWQASSEGLPEGARPQSLVVTKTGLLAGTAQGLFRSKDGKTWSAVSDAPGNVLPRPIVNAAQQPDRVFASTAQGILRSTDGGATWARLQNGAGNTPILSLAPRDNGDLYVGTARGVWKTNDDGSDWRALNVGLVSTNIHNLILVPSHPPTLLAATRFGLYRSQDRGATWSDASGLTDPYILSLAIDPADANWVYAGTWSSALFVSQDAGATFTLLKENVADHAPISGLAVLRSADGRATIYVGSLGNGLYWGRADGQSWNSQPAGLSDIKRVTILTRLAPATLYAGTERGLYRFDATQPNATWQRAGAPLPDDEVRALAIDSRPSPTLLVSFVSGELWRSDGAGAQWQPVAKDKFPPRTRLQAIAISPRAAEVVYLGTDRGVYRSDDQGHSWSAANDGLPANADIQAIAIDPARAETLFAATTANGVVVGKDSFRAAAPAISPALGVLGVLAFGALGLAYAGWRARFSPAARERAWAHEWQQWNTAIANALQTHGEANERTLSKLPRRHLARALQRYAELHPDDALTLHPSPVALQLEPFAFTQKFLSHWKAAWEVVDSEEAFKSVTSQMVDQLCTLLGFTRVDERAYRGLVGYVVRASALRLKIPPRFPIIFLPRHEVQESDLEALRDLMNILGMVSYFALLIDLRDAPATGQRSLKSLVREAIHDFIVLDGKDIRYLLAARDHPKRLIEIVLSQVDLTVVSPYVTSGPVPANMFFGREFEIKTIIRTIRDTNFAIVGGRKIGKTSVLARVHQLLQEAPEYKPFYLDCQAVHTPAEFFSAVDTMWKMPIPTASPEEFRRMALDLASQQSACTVVLLFDEIDGLLQADIAQGERLFRILRALAQEVPLRFIFCGEKVLNSALRNPQLAFFNFCNRLPLTYLKPDEARRVVIDPMQEMGITLAEGSELADEIVELAAGHPNIVQYICQRLIERINQRRERLITRADIQAISRSAQFAEYFAEVSWGNASALERLITLLLLDQPEVTLGEMAEMLRTRELRVPPEHLEVAFEDLTLFSILRRDGPKYAFAAQAFPEVLRRSQDVYGLVLSFIQEIQEGYGTP